MKLYRNILMSICFSLVISMPIFAFDIPLGEDENSISLKTTQEEHEHFDKVLPFGPTSVRFLENSFWISDGLKDRIVEFDTKGNFKNVINLDMPNYSTIGDFCFGHYGKNKEKSIYVCDVDNPIIYVFNFSGKKLGQFGSLNKKTILLKPVKIEFYNDYIYILDTERSNIFEYNTEFAQKRAIYTRGNNFFIENDFLFHISTFKGMKNIEKYNLSTRDSTYNKLDIPENDNLDFASYANETYYVGKMIGQNDSKPIQYQLLAVDNDNNKTELTTYSPVSFLVSSFVKDNHGKIYQIKYNPEESNKLTINQL